MSRRSESIGPVAATVAALGLCCGLPILASLGVAGAVAGIGLRSWLLIGLAVIVIAVGALRSRHRATCDQPPTRDRAIARDIPTRSSTTPSTPARHVPTSRDSPVSPDATVSDHVKEPS